MDEFAGKGLEKKYAADIVIDGRCRNYTQGRDVGV